MLCFWLLQTNWSEWWFPGVDRFIEMIAFMFWWGLALIVALIPLAIVVIIPVLIIGTFLDWW